MPALGQRGRYGDTRQSCNIVICRHVNTVSIIEDVIYLYDIRDSQLNFQY